MTLAKSRESTRRSSNETPDDYSIYPHREFAARECKQFRIDDYGDSGALNGEQISTLAERHNLPEEHVATLSRLVGYALDVDTDASLVKISRSTVQRRLSDPRTLNRPITNTLSSEEANALFDSLSVPVFVAEGAAAGLPSANMSENDTGAAPLAIDLDTARRVLEPDDRRNERDSRRLLVVECCCYVALDAGWSVTYTTGPRSKRKIMAPDAETEVSTERRGPLVRLIQDVVALVTENEVEFSGHTIKADLELVKLRLQMRGDL